MKLSGKTNGLKIFGSGNGTKNKGTYQEEKIMNEWRDTPRREHNGSFMSEQQWLVFGVEIDKGL